MSKRDTVDQPSRGYETGRITVAWYADPCSHTARCIASLPNAFDPRRQPKILAHSLFHSWPVRPNRFC
jgi:hypothetical protein